MQATYDNGHVVLSGISMIGNPRPIDPQRGDRHLAFDANFPVRDGMHKSSVGMFRYFLPPDFDHSLIPNGKYTPVYVVANISAPPPKWKPDNPAFSSPSLGRDGYTMIGDVVEFDVINKKDRNRVQPHITVAGMVTESHKETDSFKIVPCQYMSFLRSSAPFPANCTFPNNKRWTKKPVPTVGTMVSVAGTLSDVTRTDTHAVHVFDIDITSFAILSSARQGPIAKTSNKGKAAAEAQPPARYDFDNETSSSNGHSSNDDDDDDSEEDHDGGAASSSKAAKDERAHSKVAKNNEDESGKEESDHGNDKGETLSPEVKSEPGSLKRKQNDNDEAEQDKEDDKPKKKKKGGELAFVDI